MNRLSFRAWLGIWLALLFFGALFWAKGRDPFQRIWFTVKTPHSGKAECIAVLPKTAARPLPVVLYLHGAGGRLLASGNDLRQMAEMGLAAIGMDYNQTNEAVFAEQFVALREYVSRQSWADTNRIAWVGFNLGAQRLAVFGAQHPESAPQLLVSLSGVASNALAGWPPASRQPSAITPTMLLMRGQHDVAYPAAEAAGLARVLETKGWRVQTKTLPYELQWVEPNRRVLFRGVGEQALEVLRGPEAFRNYRSILQWQQSAAPLWPFWIPAAGWVLVRWYCRQKVGRVTPCAPDVDKLVDGAHGVARPTKLTRWEIALLWVAVVLAVLAIGVTALHLIPPQLEITPARLKLAREHLIAPTEPADFDYLSGKSFWAGKKLKTLLEHVELANYNRGLVNWKLEDEIYRRYVLSPEISPEFDGSMHWRRWLWESFYPRIRKEDNLLAAAEIIVRHLRSRVTIEGSKPLSPALSPPDGARETGGGTARAGDETLPMNRGTSSPRPSPPFRMEERVAEGRERRPSAVRGVKARTMFRGNLTPARSQRMGEIPHDIEQIWIRQLTDEKGFEAIYVAALRSAGVPARLDAQGRAEIWNGSAWKPAPRPVIESWSAQ